MQSVLIANRGEIAIRIARTVREMGLKAVMVAPEDDAASRHIRSGDAFCLLDGRGAAAYLDGPALVQAAKDCGADAVHPGYGFLSESADFAKACIKAGLYFIGPSPETLSLLGNKSRARQLAHDKAVPVPKGLVGPITLAEAMDFFKSLDAGSGAMIKAISGGGGRGARPVTKLDHLDSLFEMCSIEAQATFGDGGLYIEELIEPARHIEVQLIRDQAGNARHLYERDCTLQRSRQKVIEIAPSPSITEHVRQALFKSSLNLAHACNLKGLATFEFLVQPDGRFVFIEANPRLQVEHTVTECITGLDLVGLQISLEQGHSLQQLGLGNDRPLPARGYAMQLRLCAEKYNEAGVLSPSSGQISTLAMPDGPGVRVDTYIEQGFRPNPAYDSLVAKLIITVEQAPYARLVTRAENALKAFKTTGVETNRDLLLALLADDAVRTNNIDTLFLDRELPRFLAARKAFLPPDSISDAQSAAGHAATEGPALSEGEFALHAPLSGQLVETVHMAGESIAAGRPLAIVEAMKMQHDVLAERDCTIVQWIKQSGDTVLADDVLAVLISAQETLKLETDEEDVDLGHIRPDLQALYDRRSKLTDDARPKARDKMHARGRMTVRAILETFMDAGSFHEIGSLNIPAQRTRRSYDDLIDYAPADGMVAGIGTVNAAHFTKAAAACAIVAYDYSVFAGTQGMYNHKKKDRIFEIIYRAKIPLVLFGGGGGGRPGDTDVRIGLDIPTFYSFAKLKGHVPIIAVVAGNCFAGNAALVGIADIIIATKDASIGMGGPAMIEGGGLGHVAAADIGPVSRQAANGLVDLVVADEQEAIALAQQCLALFQGKIDAPSSQTNGTEQDQRLLRHIVPENRSRTFPVRHVIATVADKDTVVELKAAFGQAMVTAFARIDGRPVGIMANNNEVMAGAIDADAADKASRFLKLCECQRLPVISLCDTPGFMVGPEFERQGQVQKSCDLFATGANLTIPFFSIVLRKAYGLGAQAMAGGSFHAPLFSVSWPTGEFGAMGFEGAVRLGYSKELEAIADDADRQRFFDEKLQQLYDENKAIAAAEFLEIDDVIDPIETRQWIVHGLVFASQN